MRWRLWFVFAFFILLNMWLEREEISPRRPVPEGQPPDFGEIRGPLPETSVLDPEVAVGLGEKTDSTGTAFALEQAGWWMTARHVVDQCNQIQLRFPRHRGILVEKVIQHRNADLAILFARVSAGAALRLGGRLYVGQNGYQVGYPRGSPGEVWSTLLGRRRMRVSGRYRTAEPVVAWAEKGRRPSGLRSLGGLSGGPALDGAGRAVGVLVAESTRRGRVYTAALVSMKQLLPPSTDKRGTGREITISPKTLQQRAGFLRTAPSIAKVICLVGS